MPRFGLPDVVTIGYLVDHPECAATLTRWHYEEWHSLMPELSFADFGDELASHRERAAIPTTLVAVAGAEVVGSASLIVEDFPEWRQFTPWVASVFIAPTWRGRGIGTELVGRLVRLAGELGVPNVYLGTPDRVDFYRERGWSVVAAPENPARPIIIMARACRVPG
jgi:N-acetylglutamate synthase-like GNAT family acetyltransferase